MNIRKMLQGHVRFTDDLGFDAPPQGRDHIGPWMLAFALTLIAIEVIAQIAMAHGALQ